MEPLLKGESIMQWIKRTAPEELTHSQKIERELEKIRARYSKKDSLKEP